MVNSNHGCLGQGIKPEPNNTFNTFLLKPGAVSHTALPYGRIWHACIYIWHTFESGVYMMYMPCCHCVNTEQVIRQAQGNSGTKSSDSEQQHKHRCAFKTKQQRPGLPLITRACVDFMQTEQHTMVVW